jgi:membrane protein YqaA with SNARE-associated domain
MHPEQPAGWFAVTSAPAAVWLCEGADASHGQLPHGRSRGVGLFGQVVNHFIATWGYYAVFLLCALEGFGFFFALIAAAITSAGGVARETHHLNIIWVLLAALCGALLGGNVSFWVGHEYGFPLLNRYGHYISLNFKRLKFVQYLYLRYGRRIVFVGPICDDPASVESFLAGARR